MNEERDERTFSKMEQQIAKQELSIRGMNDRERSWFQTMKQRRQERDRLDQNYKDAEAVKLAASGKLSEIEMTKLSASKRKKKEDAEKKLTPSQQAKQRVRQAQEKASFLRAKASKIAMKTKRIRQVDAPAADRQESAKKKKVSKFAVDLTNTSRRNAKNLR